MAQQNVSFSFTPEIATKVIKHSLLDPVKIDMRP